MGVVDDGVLGRLPAEKVVRRAAEQQTKLLKVLDLDVRDVKIQQITRRRPPDAVLHQKRQVLPYPTQPKNTPRIEFKHNVLRVLACDARITITCIRNRWNTFR